MVESSSTPAASDWANSMEQPVAIEHNEEDFVCTLPPPSEGEEPEVMTEEQIVNLTTAAAAGGEALAN